jgi:hypothetical protein
MPKKIIRTTMTITVEEEYRSSSSFPAAAEVIETTGQSVPSDFPPRPLAKAAPRDGARKAV